MAIWASIAKMFRSRKEPVSQEDLANLLRGEDSWTGLEVDQYSALGLPIVWACVRVLAETLASLPLILYRRIDGGKERAEDHPLFDILHIQPNPEQTSFIFKEQLQGYFCGMTFENVYFGKNTYGKFSIGFSYNHHSILYRMPIKDDSMISLGFQIGG